MSDRAKKIIFAAAFIVLSIAIGFGLYYFFFRPLVNPPTPVVPGGPVGTLPTAPGGVPGTGVEPTAPGGLQPAGPGTGVPGAPTPGTPVSRTTLLRDGVTQAVAAGANGQGARFYNPEDGRFYRVNADGTITALGDKQFFNVDNVSWGKRDDRAVIEFPDGSNVFYDFDSKRQVTLPKHWEDFSFSPDDERIAAKSIGLDPSNRFLIVSKADGNEAQAIEALGKNADKAVVQWSPNSQVIAFAKTGRPQAEGAEEVYLIGENHENFKSLIVPGRGFLPNWSPAGRQILYSVYHERDELRPSLWISGGVGDDIGENRKGLNLNTWADKCAWRSESELICGVPQTVAVGAGLAPDKYASVPDDVYRVNLATGVSTKINTPDQIHPIRQPVMSADKSKLLFTDAVTGRLYSYDLQ
jgi:Tol biopolymer transport system component